MVTERIEASLAVHSAPGTSNKWHALGSLVSKSEYAQKYTDQYFIANILLWTLPMKEKNQRVTMQTTSTETVYNNVYLNSQCSTDQIFLVLLLATLNDRLELFV